MILTDTHTHLFLKEFEDDREEVISHAKSEGVKYMLLPNVDSSTIDALHNTCEKFSDCCFPFIGLHPTSVKEDYKKELDIVVSSLSDKSIKHYAIGEIGIDMYWDKTFLEEQKDAMRFQIELAKKHDLPIVIHSRISVDIIIDILKEMKHSNLRGVFHCYPGNKEQAEIIKKLGFKIGIGGIVTFKNAGLDKLVENIDLEDIVLETDSPYLTPTPFRGKRNESSYLKYIAQKVAELKKCSIEEVAEKTTNNAIELFNFV